MLFSMHLPPPQSPLFPYTTLFRSDLLSLDRGVGAVAFHDEADRARRMPVRARDFARHQDLHRGDQRAGGGPLVLQAGIEELHRDRKSTRLNSSHANISYAVFFLKK